MLVNGRRVAQVRADDRGLAYGDGLFETVRVRDGTAPLWRRHMARLAAGCARLALPPPDIALIEAECMAVADGLTDAVVKIVLTRGVGGRGYAPPQDARPTRVVSAHALPVPYTRTAAGGIAVRWCDWRLSAQPALAGIKHLNRLDQVLARAEWCDPAIAEGLLRDQRGLVVCATAGNVFAAIDGALCTPELTQSGVAGVCRATIIAERLAGDVVVVRDMLPAELERADEVFVCNSVRGVVPVSSLGARTWRAPGARTRAAIDALAQLGLPSESSP
jgi:4-amino-4-deoxychorismate lyase